MRNDCLFCAIWDREVPAEEVERTESTLAFRDIKPQAPIHVLIIPKEHVRSVAELTDTQSEIGGDLLLAARRIAESLGVARDGYRLIINTRHHGGQEVDHLHLHLLAGEPLGRLVP